MALNLPRQLRGLPDFFVSTNEIDQTWLVEVKYRKSWTPEVQEALEAQLREQVENWHPLFLMIFLGNSFDGVNSSPIYHMKVVKLDWDADEGLVTDHPEKGRCPWKYSKWEKFMRIQDVFTKCKEKERWEAQTIEKTKEIAIKLKDLDLFE